MTDPLLTAGGVISREAMLNPASLDSAAIVALAVFAFAIRLIAFDALNLTLAATLGPQY